MRSIESTMSAFQNFAAKNAPCFLTFRSVNLDQKQVLNTWHCGFMILHRRKSVEIKQFCSFALQKRPSFQTKCYTAHPCIDSTRNMHQFCHNFNIFKELLFRGLYKVHYAINLQ